MMRYLLFCLILLTACSTPPQASPPIPAQTVLETLSPSIETSAPEAAPESGPWLMFAGPDGIWAYDTSNETPRLVENRVPLAPQDVNAMPAPSGARTAYITGRDGIEDLSLNVLQLPAGRIDAIPLIAPEFMPAAGIPPEDPTALAVRAIFEVTSIAWAPDGGAIAFVGVLEGPSADLYLVRMADLENGSRAVPLRLTFDPGQEIQPAWSPDGSYLVYASVDNFGNGAGYAMNGVWIVRADGSENRLLYDTGNSGGELFVGWLDERTLIVHSWTAVCESERLRTVDILSGAVREIWAGPFNGVALDPAAGSLLVTVDAFTSNCAGAAAQGLYFLPRDGEAVHLIGDEAFLPIWSAGAGLFFARTPSVVLAVDPRGSALQLQAPEPFLPSASSSADLAWIAIGGVWVGTLNSAAELIFNGNAALPAWSPDGEVLYFLGEAGLYRAIGPGFEAELIGEGVTGGVAFWLSP